MRKSLAPIALVGEALIFCGRLRGAGQPCPQLRGGQAASFMTIEEPEAMLLYEFVAFRQLEILAHHFADEIAERGLRRPAKLALGLRSVAQQGLDLRRSEIAGIDRDDAIAGLGIVAFFIDALTFPAHLDADLFGGTLDE